METCSSAEHHLYPAYVKGDLLLRLRDASFIGDVDIEVVIPTTASHYRPDPTAADAGIAWTAKMFHVEQRYPRCGATSSA